MKISNMYLLIVIGWFFAGLPINIAVFIYASMELNKEHTDKELMAIKLAQVISGLFALGMTIFIFR